MGINIETQEEKATCPQVTGLRYNACPIKPFCGIEIAGSGRIKKCFIMQIFKHMQI